MAPFTPPPFFSLYLSHCHILYFTLPLPLTVLLLCSLSLCSFPLFCAPTDKVEPDTLKKTQSLEGAPGLVPYGGDSSDEEDDRTRSSKKS